MEQWAKYIGVSGTMALILIIAMVVWVSLAITVPDLVYGFVGTAVGYYMGTNGHVIKTEVDRKASNVT